MTDVDTAESFVGIDWAAWLPRGLRARWNGS